MLNNVWFIACIWMGLALIASLISIRTGISVALIEILVGVIVGNLAVGSEGGTLQVGIAGAAASAGHLHQILQSTEWTNFLALLGSGVLTFLAGAEIDPISLKANWRASMLIGVLSFAIPFVVVWVFAQFVCGLCPRRHRVLFPAQPANERFAGAAPWTRTRRKTAPRQRSWMHHQRTEDFAGRFGFVPFAGGIHRDRRRGASV